MRPRPDPAAYCFSTRRGRLWDGKGYLVYDDGHRNLRVDLLADDYLSSSGRTVIALQCDPTAGKRYEGAAMIRYKGKYIVAGSGVQGWKPTDTTYAVADTPLGPYREMGLMSEQKTWSSQISNFVYLPASDQVFAMCDLSVMPRRLRMHPGRTET